MQISTQIELANPQIPLNIDNPCLSINSNTQVDLKLFYSLTETKSYTPIPSCLLDYIITTTKLSSVEKLYYLLADNLASISSNLGNKRNIILSAEDWAEKLNYSPTSIFDLQKSIEKKGFFKVVRKKNEYNQNNRNLIIPTIPSDVFKYLSLNSKKNNTNGYYFFDSSKESKRDFLSKTDYFFMLNHDLLEIITGNEKLTSTQKVIWLDLYIKAYNNLKITQNLFNKNFSVDGIGSDDNVTATDDLYLIAAYSELEKKYSCSNSNGALTKNLQALQNAGFINIRQVKTLKNSLGGQRKDKFLCKISIYLPDDHIIALSNSKDRSLKKIDENITNDKKIYFDKNNLEIDYKDNNKGNSEIKNTISFSSELPVFPDSCYGSNLNFISSCTEGDSSQSLRNINIIPLSINDLDYIDVNNKNISSDLSSSSIFFKNSSFNFDKNSVNSVHASTIEIEAVTSESVFTSSEYFKERENIQKKEPKELGLENTLDIENPENSSISPESNHNITNNNDETKEALEKTFEYFDPITPKLAAELNKRAGREFNTHFTNQLLKKFIKLYPDKVFANHYCFYSYMVKALRHEKHQAPLVNHETFNLTINISEEQKEMNRKNNYLAKIETSACTSPNALLAKKLASKFETNLAHSLLTEAKFEVEREYELEKDHEQFNEMREGNDSDIQNALEAQKLLAKHKKGCGEEIIELNEIDLSKSQPFRELTTKELETTELSDEKQIDSVILHNVMVVSLSETISLTDLEKRLLENEIKAVYGDINVIYKQLQGRVINYSDNSQGVNTNKEEHEYSPLWQKIRAELKGYFGENWLALDKAWFSKLEAEISDNTGNVVINAPSGFYRDWITNHYLRFLEESCKALNLKLINLVQGDL